MLRLVLLVAQVQQACLVRLVAASADLWPVRLVPVVIWKSIFWLVRNGAAAARQGWEAMSPVGLVGRKLR